MLNLSTAKFSSGFFLWLFANGKEEKEKKNKRLNLLELFFVNILNALCK